MSQSFRTPCSGAVPGSIAMATLQAIGSRRFAHDLLAGVRSNLLASYCSLFHIRPSTGATVIDVAGLDTLKPALMPAQRYVESKFYGHDPMLVGWSAARATGWVGLHSASEIQVEAYRSDCYESLGLHQRCSLVFPWQADEWLALNFYRHRDDQAFTVSELDSLINGADFLAAAVIHHLALIQQVRGPKDRIDQLFEHADLTAREKQVLMYALQGLSNKEIGKQLGLEPSTVITYRERAYRRLSVGRHADLVRLILN